MAAEETLNSGSDQDVEIDIDGSDSDESHYHLMPGISIETLNSFSRVVCHETPHCVTLLKWHMS